MIAKVVIARIKRIDNDLYMRTLHFKGEMISGGLFSIENQGENFEGQKPSEDQVYLSEMESGWDAKPLTAAENYSAVLIANYTDAISNAVGVSIQEDILLVTDYFNSITTVNISNPSNPVYLDHFQSAEYVTSGAYI